MHHPDIEIANFLLLLCVSNLLLCGFSFCSSENNFDMFMDEETKLLSRKSFNFTLMIFLIFVFKRLKTIRKNCVSV